MQKEMDEEIKDSMALITGVIRDYEAGDDSLEDDVLYIIRSVWKYCKRLRMNKLRYRMVIEFYKIISKNFNVSHEYRDSVFASIESYYEFYASCVEALKEYLDTGFKTDDFPNLEDAYLLSISASDILENIDDYIDALVNSSVANNYNYEYYRSSNLDEKCETRKKSIKKLVDSIS